MDTKWYGYYIKNKCQSKYVNYRNKLAGKGICHEYSISDIKKYAGKKTLSGVETNEYISDKIQKVTPCFIGRFGGNELQMVVSLLKRSPYALYRQAFLDSLCSNAGFFPNDLKYAEKFKSLMLDSCGQLDLCGIWNLFMEDYILECYAPNCSLTILGYLEPFTLYWQKDTKTKPWTHSLEGKKVLVIHPFAETIRKQYEKNRENIFRNIYPAEDILPKFELITLKAVQTINGTGADRYTDWFDALGSMIEKCQSIDFEVAIIGCGAYGFPLAAEIKKMGKVAIHLGGVTQRLFGIKGKRWTQGGYGEQSKVMENEYWVHPAKEERPKDFDKIEGGCYW